jgi:leucyl aminopeptidase (aminopeptidase T)
MEGSLFGVGSVELEAGARNAVEVCLAIQPDEHVALIADEASGEVAASIADALDRVGAPWEGVLIEKVAGRPLAGAPPQVLEALEHADAGILCIQPQQ